MDHYSVPMDNLSPRNTHEEVLPALLVFALPYKFSNLYVRSVSGYRTKKLALVTGNSLPSNAVIGGGNHSQRTQKMGDLLIWMC